MLDTRALAKAFSPLTELAPGLTSMDDARRREALERARHLVAQNEKALGEAQAASDEMVALAKKKDSTVPTTDIEHATEACLSLEHEAASWLKALRGVQARTLTFLSETDRAMFHEVRGLIESDIETATKFCEMARDARWALMAARAQRTPDEDAVEIKSAADLRRSLIGS